MEDAVYVCSWSQSPDGFVLWVKSRPHIRAHGGTYLDAEERLIEAIQDAGGAMHAALEFDPPLPKSTLEEKYTNPEIYLIGGDDGFDPDGPKQQWSETASQMDERLRWHDAFFQAPVCRKCNYASSPRTDKPLSVAAMSSGYDGAFGSVGYGVGPSIQIVSQTFLGLLLPHEKEHLQFRPVNWRGRRKFFELIGPAGPPLVAAAGLTLAGWRCAACDYRTYGYWIEDMDIHLFVAKSDLPPSLNGVFTVGACPEVLLAVTASRWKELVGRKGTRGFASGLLGVVPDHEVIRHPELPER